jgi:dUTP pyrophosphatase
MDNNDIKKYIEQLKTLEKSILSDDDNLDFVGELNSLLGKLDEEVKTDFFNQKGMSVKVKKLHQNSVIPTYSKPNDAGMDLTISSIIDETVSSITYGFGIALEIPNGFVGLVFPRSSVRNKDLILSNCVGVIDSGYRGEIQATFKKTNGSDSIKYGVGDRAAQIMIIAYPQINFVESDQLNETERGNSGFGSTGL